MAVLYEMSDLLTGGTRYGATVSGVSFYISGGKGTCAALAAADVESVGGRSRKPRQGHLA